MRLLENAASSIVLGIEDHKLGGRRQISAVRNLHAGILLLYKELLRRLSPEKSDEVLLKRKNRPKKQSDGSIKFVGYGKTTVDTREIRERFESLDIAVDWKRLQTVTDIRNDIEHYYTTVGEDVVNRTISESFILIRDFLRDHLREDPIDILGEETWQEMINISEVHEKERKECIAKIRLHPWVFPALGKAVESYECALCGSNLIEPQTDDRQSDMKCRSCGSTEHYNSVARGALHEEFYDHGELIDGGDPAIVSCPFCGEDAYHIASEQCAICEESATHVCEFCENSISAWELTEEKMCAYCLHKLGQD